MVQSAALWSHHQWLLNPTHPGAEGISVFGMGTRVRCDAGHWLAIVSEPKGQVPAWYWASCGGCQSMRYQLQQHC
jgi:hypothetical protein